jgi:hypothetical protein
VEPSDSEIAVPTDVENAVPKDAENAVPTDAENAEPSERSTLCHISGGSLGWRTGVVKDRDFYGPDRQ